ncbi:hypothetical protein ACTXT7_006222 [Hymenolepis weldensis]
MDFLGQMPSSYKMANTSAHTAVLARYAIGYIPTLSRMFKHTRDSVDQPWQRCKPTGPTYHHICCDHLPKTHRRLWTPQQILTEPQYIPPL